MAETNNTNQAENEVLSQSELSEQMRIRREKLDALKEQGNDPYQLVKYPVDHASADIKENFEDLHYIQDGLIDLNTSNCFFINNELYVYDQEWYEKNVPLEFIIHSLFELHVTGSTPGTLT